MKEFHQFPELSSTEADGTPKVIDRFSNKLNLDKEKRSEDILKFNVYDFNRKY